MKTLSSYFGYLAAVLSIAGLLLVSHAPISAAAPNPDSCFTTIGTTSRTITGYDLAGAGCGLTVEIPSSIGGGTVVGIGNQAFYNLQITSVTIPSTVTTIGSEAFAYNELATIDIPNSVISLEDGVFSSNLLTSVTVSNVVTSIGNSAFAGNDLSSVTLGSAVTSIGNSAFYANQLTTITLPESVTTVGNFSFYQNQLESVSLGSSLTSIGDYAFNANRLSTVTVPNTLTTIGDYAFSMQSPHGADIWDLIYDDDAAVNLESANSIWYVRLYTSNPANSQGLTDSIAFEETELDGQDDDWDEQLIAGGYLVNPIGAELRFVDKFNDQVFLPITLTGKNSNDSRYYGNYIASSGPNVPFPANTWSPSPADLAVALASLSQYYRVGDTLTYTAALVNGVAPTPASFSFVLGATTASNERQFVYASPTSSSVPQVSTQLANTGMSMWFVVAGALVVLVGSIGVMARK